MVQLLVKSECWESSVPPKDFHTGKELCPGSARAGCPYSSPQAVQTAVLPSIINHMQCSCSKKTPCGVAGQAGKHLAVTSCDLLWSSKVQANMEKTKIPHVLFHLCCSLHFIERPVD